MASRLVALLLLSLGVQYLIWRVGSTLNLSSATAATFSLMALVAELLMLGAYFLQLAFCLWPPLRPATGSVVAKARKDLTPIRDGVTSIAGVEAAAAGRDLFTPSVDVLVPSYGEPPELIERCLRGCLALDYPRHTLWLLDDSGRPELAALCDGLGVRYLHRPQRQHAKAGNLNHALGHCEGELIAVFDADVVPLQSFLRDIVPLFADPRLGFVQTPQSAMNADPVMRNLRLERWLLPDEESFYRWIEPCREAVGAVVCAGTSFVMRREALDRVGGFETDTPAEDLATGIRLTALGYRNRYLTRKLSAGLAPFTAAAMARQRCRWASGTVQVLRTGANPLTIPGLNPLQRLAYFEGMWHWFNVLPQLLLVLLPLSLALFGVTPILVSAEGLVRHALPFYGAQLLLVRWLNHHSRTALLPELYRWIFLLPLAGAVVATLLGRPQRFRVTPKQQQAGGAAAGPVKRLLLPLLLLLALQGMSALRLLAPAPGLNAQPLLPATAALAWGWIAANSLLLALAIRTCWPRPGLAPEPWFALRLPCRLSWAEGKAGAPARGPGISAQLRAISEAGVELRLRGAVQLPSDRPLSLELPGLPSLSLRVVAERQAGGWGWAWLDKLGLRVAHTLGLRTRRPLDWGLGWWAGNGLEIGGRWEGLTAGQRQRLQAFLYSRPGVWPERRAPLEPLALLVVLGRLLVGCRGETWFRRSLIEQAAAADGDLPWT